MIIEVKATQFYVRTRFYNMAILGYQGECNCSWVDPIIYRNWSLAYLAAHEHTISHDN